MSRQQFTTIFFPSDFTSLGGGSVNIDTLRVAFTAAFPADQLVELVSTNTVRVISSVFPTSVELLALIAAAANHTGFATTSGVQQFTNLGNVDTNGAAGNSPLVSVFDVTTAPLNTGSWLILVATDLFMPAIVANTFISVEFRIGINANPTVRIGGTTYVSTDQAHSGGFDPHAILDVIAGQQIHFILQIQKLGAAAAITRANNSRASLCKVA